MAIGEINYSYGSSEGRVDNLENIFQCLKRNVHCHQFTLFGGVLALVFRLNAQVYYVNFFVLIGEVYMESNFVMFLQIFWNVESAYTLT